MPSVGQLLGDRGGEQPAYVGEPRVVGVVVGTHATAEADQPGVAGEVGRHGVGRRRDDVEVGAGRGQPVAERARRVVGVGLDDEQSGHGFQGRRRSRRGRELDLAGVEHGAVADASGRSSSTSGWPGR